MTADLDPIRARLAAQRAPNDHDCEQATDDLATLLARCDELEAALRFIADWAADCTFDENGSADTFYGFIDIEKQARAVLGEP